MFLNAKGTHGDVTDSTKAFLKYVDDHVVTDGFTQELDAELIHIKNDPKVRRSFMKYEMNVKDIRAKALLQGEENGITKTIIGMLKAGATYEFVAKATNYSIDKIKEIAKQQNLI